uniref:P-type Cu(2+) transporter n=1 Tax=Opuntia streptacantha TaxID=393608 RepID=A0A7C9DKA7_OPUST
MAADLLRLSLSPRSITPGHRNLLLRPHCHSLTSLHRHQGVLLPSAGAIRRNRGLVVAKAVDIGAPAGVSSEEKPANSSFLLDVNGMMCGACVSRVKGILSADKRVESAVVNMLTETAAVTLNPEAAGGGSAAEDLAKRLSACGFDAKPRVAGSGVGERVRKWKEMAAKKEAMLEKSTNRVAVAWTLVALCCGSHASHIFHSLGIHVTHGGFWDVLHNSYVKGALALGALMGPGRDLLQDGLRAFVKGSPNMNSLVGFGSIAAFILSAVSLMNPGLDWDASFFDEPVMLLGFVLLGRSLEEGARIKASSDMNELLCFLLMRFALKYLLMTFELETTCWFCLEKPYLWM